MDSSKNIWFFDPYINWFKFIMTGKPNYLFQKGTISEKFKSIPNITGRLLIRKIKKNTSDLKWVIGLYSGFHEPLSPVRRFVKSI